MAIPNGITTDEIEHNTEYMPDYSRIDMNSFNIFYLSANEYHLRTTNEVVLEFLVELANKVNFNKVAETLYDMNIFGERILDIFVGYCEFDINAFIKKCTADRSERDADMITWINKVAIVKGIKFKAVTEGALKEGEHFPSPLRTVFTPEEMSHRKEIIKELIAQGEKKLIYGEDNELIKQYERS